MANKRMLSIVIPCFNEEAEISALAGRLKGTVASLRKGFNIELIFVDDGSTDRTYGLLQEHFGTDKDSFIMRHEKNRNLGGALRTGFSRASGELIATLDSDCTYDPGLLVQMLELMDEETDIVTVSPYHPQGGIENVARHRVLMSRAVSMMYRSLISWRIYTYSAMVRVFRRRALAKARFESNDFLSVTEMMVNAILGGCVVKELPAVLRSRQNTPSKMRTTKEIGNHLRYLTKLAVGRLEHRR